MLELKCRLGSTQGESTPRRDIPDINLPTSAPAGPHPRTGNVLSRPFDKGKVYLNSGDRPAHVTLWRTLIRMQAGEEPAQREGGDTIIVPRHDAVFLLEPGSLAALERNS